MLCRRDVRAGCLATRLCLASTSNDWLPSNAGHWHGVYVNVSGCLDISVNGSLGYAFDHRSRVFDCHGEVYGCCIGSYCYDSLAADSCSRHSNCCNSLHRIVDCMFLHTGFHSAVYDDVS